MEAPLPMNPIHHPSIIDERSCILQNYGLPSPNSDDLLTEPPAVVFYDYALEQDSRDLRAPPARGDGQTAAKKVDQSTQLSLQKLYRGNRLNSGYFPEKRLSGAPDFERSLFLRVIDFPELKCSGADNFLHAMKDQMDLKGQEMGHETLENLTRLIPRIPPQLDWSNLQATFKSGISFNAFGSDNLELLILMLYMPYFDISVIPPDRSESLSLSEYRFLESGTPLGGEYTAPETNDQKNVLVHQAWFMVFNNDLIAMFRSADDKHSDPIMGTDRPRPLYPDQERIGAFHALVQMISNIFTASRKRPLVYLRQQISTQEYYVRHHVSGPNDESQRQILNGLIANVTTVRSILQSQIEILEDLRDVYENTITSPKMKNCFNKNAVKIPVLRGLSEEIPPAVMAIEKIIEERRNYRLKFDGLLERVEKAKKALERILKSIAISNGIEKHIQKMSEDQVSAIREQTIMLDNAATNQTADLGTAAAEQALKSEAAIKQQTEEMEKQRQVMSAFTILTTLFLPLGFLASYFSMMGAGGFLASPDRHELFWKWCGSTTALVGLFTLGAVCRSRIRASAAAGYKAWWTDYFRPSWWTNIFKPGGSKRQSLPVYTSTPHVAASATCSTPQLYSQPPTVPQPV